MQNQETIKILLDIPSDVYFKVSADVLAKKKAGDRKHSIRKSCISAIIQSVTQ